MAPSKPRDYDRTTRLAGSAATRERILDVARTSLIAHGYRATRIVDVAAAAGVHIATVYELVGRKPVILRELLERAISGSNRPVQAADRDYVAAMRAEPSPMRKLEIYAAAIRTIQARLAPLVLALRDAASTEPEAATVWRELSDRRAANMRTLVVELDAAGGLRADLTIDDAADFVWVTNSAEVYVLMTNERGWTPDRYQRWLVEVWSRHLLPVAQKP